MNNILPSPASHTNQTGLRTVQPERFIHLLYAPTSACQLRCAYCYRTEYDEPEYDDSAVTSDAEHPVDTLRRAVAKLRGAGYFPFNISLHGGEPTCLPCDQFEELIAFISDYYHDNAGIIQNAVIRVGRPHIKTNLYGIERHLDTIERYRVTVSGSLDLPFSLHDEYRLTANGRPTLPKILDNLKLLEDIPVKKKASATIFREHFDRIDEIARDIRYLHEHTCLDMNDFNFMIGFADENCPLTPLTPDEQVAFFDRMHVEFDGTELDAGVNGPWFAEFTPDYCTGCMNCGEKFFLLDAAGEVYSCPRGQGHEAFHYGNLLNEPVEKVLAAAKMKVFLAHNQAPMDEACTACAYLRFCKTGCPFVKTLMGNGQSYTCTLQQTIYRRNPNAYPASPDARSDAYRYASEMRPAQAASLAPSRIIQLPGDIPPLRDLIDADPAIAGIFDSTAFRIRIDGVDFPMQSQVLRTARTITDISRDSEVLIYVRKDIMETATRWPVNNALYIQLLSGTLVTYGDENRTKQEHVVTHQVYLNTLARGESDDPACYCFDASGLIGAYYDNLEQDPAHPNNLFVTTSALRDVHYAKHKANAYYHIQTINLPFPNIEFTVDDGK